jgi:hypothetical protein
MSNVNVVKCDGCGKLMDDEAEGVISIVGYEVCITVNEKTPFDNRLNAVGKKYNNGLHFCCVECITEFMKTTVMEISER